MFNFFVLLFVYQLQGHPAQALARPFATEAACEQAADDLASQETQPDVVGGAITCIKFNPPLPPVDPKKAT